MKTTKVYSSSCLPMILEHQQRIESAQELITGLQAAIEEQDRVLQKMQAEIPGLPDRDSQRENLLAEIAMGEESEDALQRLDNKIEREKSAQENAKKHVAPIIEKANAIRAGLSRRLAATVAEKQLLENKSQEMRRMLLKAEAERVAEEYITNAQALIKNYLHLRGLEILIIGESGQSVIGVNKYAIAEFFIPVFATPQFEGMENRNAGIGAMYSARNDMLGNAFQSQASQQKSALEKQGVLF